MTDKSNFTPDEWKLIMQSPMMAGLAVSAAEPSGLWGTLKESLAAGGALAKATTDSNANALVRAVATGFTSADGTAARDGIKEKLAGGKPADIKVKSIETLRQVSTLIDTKAPSDAAAFKAWLRQISEHTAEAAAEGGILGFGGVQVSDAERATLAEVSSALK
jgi:hypothetical protein